MTSVEVRTEPAAALTVRLGDQETLIHGTGEIHTHLPGDAARVTVALALSRPS